MTGRHLVLDQDAMIQRLNEVIEAFGGNVAEAARHVGVSRQTMVNWRRGATAISVTLSTSILAAHANIPTVTKKKEKTGAGIPWQKIAGV